MIERMYADRPNWTRVLQKKFSTKYIKNIDFNGYVSMIYIEKVKQPLIKNMLGKDYCLVDDGYIWLELLPIYGNYHLTAMYNNNTQIVQWYFDITKQKGVSEDGIPFFDDLFLDVVVLPNSEILLLDEDELKDALDKCEITEQEYNTAYQEAKQIIENIAIDINTLSDFTNKYLKVINSSNRE
ncbi:DUF402 domain-containing protein [Oceanirhabdus seepicola]|uniref:DUF402 domain-containing protein n=1 Tax=Oceanirhabdus seepicola TaxID=2828781 RepID=A0A9J6P467_9CLOT|nr:DUF402 domain-containing protein [Oceanirhabdus seepicola]MCM1991347.1 DUF402 domain-containing protein [Oceanirhabdus seepicola]